MVTGSPLHLCGGVCPQLRPTSLLSAQGQAGIILGDLGVGGPQTTQQNLRVPIPLYSLTPYMRLPHRQMQSLCGAGAGVLHPIIFAVLNHPSTN